MSIRLCKSVKQSDAAHLQGVNQGFLYLYLECPSRSKDGCVSIEQRDKGCVMGKQRCVGIVQWRLPVVIVLVGIVNGILLSGVVGGVPLVGGGVVVSMGLSLLVDSAVLGALLVAVLSPVERCEMHIYDCNYSTYVTIV